MDSGKVIIVESTSSTFFSFYLKVEKITDFEKQLIQDIKENIGSTGRKYIKDKNMWYINKSYFKKFMYCVSRYYHNKIFSQQDFFRG